MDLEINLNLNLSKIVEDGKILTPVFGQGFTGLENLGNSCYMNSVVQVLFSLEPLITRYFENSYEHLMICNNNANNCHLCQISKIFVGLLTGYYSKQKEREIIGSDGKPKLDEKEIYQDGIAPITFKNFYNKDNQEFMSNKQQDAYEYMNFLLDKLDAEEKKLGRSNISEIFDFDVETKLQCTGCWRYKINSIRTRFLNFFIPFWKEKKEKNLECTIEECLQAWINPTQVKYNCEFCKKETIFNSSQRLSNLPKYLLISYNRFVYDWVPFKLDIDFSFDENNINLDILTKEFAKVENENPFPEDKDADVLVEPEFNKDALNYLLELGVPELGTKHALLKNNQIPEDSLNWYFNNAGEPSLLQPIPKISSKSGQNKTKVLVSENLVLQMMEYGFSANQAKGALIKFNSNIENATNFLFEHPDFEFKEESQDQGNNQNSKKKEINLNNSSNFYLQCKYF